MKSFVIGLLLLLISISTYGQTVTQTYVDRCTGEVHTFQINSQGLTTIVFYNRSRTFTTSDISSGIFNRWLEETYNWWRSLNPCSVAQANTTVTQIVTNNIPSTQNFSSPSQTQQSTPSSTGQSSQSSQSSQESSQSSQESSQSSQESSQSDNSDADSSDTDSSDNDSSNDSDSDSDSEDENNDSSVAPPIVSANIMSMSNPLGGVNIITSVGISQSSLIGNITKSANLMIWDNLQQFALNVSRTEIFFNDKQEVDVIRSSSVNTIYAFGTIVVTAGISDVYIGKPNTWRENMVFGYAANIMGLITDEYSLTYALTAFGTKSFSFNRKTISPLVALTTSPFLDSQNNNKLTYSFSSVVGSNFDFDLTKRFKANLGGNLIITKNAPPLYSITIGSRFQF